MFFDPVYLLFLAPGLVLTLYATIKVKGTFARYRDVPTASGRTGAEVAQELLRRNNVRGVRVEPHEGFLSDHYDPKDKVVRLSPDVYYGRSISAVGVAAHECGHALQDAQGYAPMAIRQNLVVPANFGSTLSMVLIVAGFLLHATKLVWLGIFAFSAVVLFQLVTLPVEFNASSRARLRLVADGLVSREEETQVGKVLNAAALTYVAALITSVLTLAYYILRATGSSSSDD
ncbi:MAG: zinc metallopeptidase [Deltaproteobacteria bacterium]|nr:zinc metallopeptidase [Deltaproteobacteria bacterium]